MSTRTFSKTLIAAAVGVALLAACATVPVTPEGAVQVRARLTELQSNADLATRAPVAFKEAEAAVSAAEQPQPDVQLAQHRVYIADRKVETARAQAETRFAEDQRASISQQSEVARLDARTREADAAKVQAADARADSAEQKQVANAARADSAEQKLAANEARGDADAARVAATSSQLQATELQRQIDELQARVTDRGLVLTLGDVLFTSGQADLKAGAGNNLNKLIHFLNAYPNRTVAIEGYTDSVGSEDYNQGLSERRAEAVKSYLVGQGIGTMRLVASGKGESEPVAGNESAAGRQQNRRVEVVINNPPAALR
ncbi:MAG TPA: OmpA family protein [Acidobacteriaceae bacterium]|nr:OmpA family protein [Acidobacteriaceae bacterium]